MSNSGLKKLVSKYIKDNPYYRFVYENKMISDGYIKITKVDLKNDIIYRKEYDESGKLDFTESDMFSSFIYSLFDGEIIECASLNEKHKTSKAFNSSLKDILK